MDEFLKPNTRLLELNAGTGIDALHFVREGHRVHATDISPGMIEKISEKIHRFSLHERLTVQLCSFEGLDSINNQKFEYVFSNFGGLNCCRDLTNVAKHLPGLLNPQGFLTWVIMPPVSLWEWSWILAGRKAAFRRLRKGGTLAHLEGEFFRTYYHSLHTIKRKLGSDFHLIKAEGLGALSPPPASYQFALNHPMVYSFMNKVDHIACAGFPFNRWTDHIMASFQYRP